MALKCTDKTANVVTDEPNENQNTNDAINFTEALEKTGYGIFNYCLILLGGVVLSCNLYETSSIGFILPIAECDLKLSNHDKGILSAVCYFGIIVSSHFWGFMADTKGRRAVILPSLLISSVVSILSSFSHQLWLLIVLRFINGCFISSLSTYIVYLGEFHSDRTRTGAIMAASSIFSITAMLLPILAWGIINQSWSISLPFIGIVYKPWRLLILVCGSIGLFAGLIMMLFPESPKFLLSKGKTDEAIDVLKKMHKWNVRSGDLQISEITADEEDIQVQNDTSLESSSLLRVFLQTVWNQTIPLFQKTLLIPTILICTIQFWMCVGIYGIFMWYPIITDSMVSSMSHNYQNVSSICDAVYAKQAETLAIDNNVQHCTEKLEDRTFIFSIMMEFFFGMGYVVIGILVQKVQKKHILFATLIIFGTCGVLTNLINDKTFSLIAFNMFFISGIGIQLLCGITIELYPTHLRAMAICISVMFGRLGGVAGASITGLMMASNCEMTFYIAGTGLIVSGFLTLLIPKKENEKTLESVVE